MRTRQFGFFVLVLVIFSGAAQVLRNWRSLHVTSSPLPDVPGFLSAARPAGNATAAQPPAIPQRAAPWGDVDDAIRDKVAFVELLNVCWQVHPTKADTKGGGLVQVFTDNDAIMQLVLAGKPDQHAMRMGVGFERRPFAEFAGEARKRGLYHEDADVLLHFPVPNPMHCLHDVVFSLFAVFAANGTTPEARPWFDAYLNAKEHGRACNPEVDWCCFLVDRLNVWPSVSAVVPASSSCFRRLWVPRLMHHRFATDWSKSPKGERIGYMETRPSFYPITALHELKRRALTERGGGILDPAARPKALRRNVVVLDRSDSLRRIWDNAADFVSQLVRLRGSRFHSFSFYGKGWRNLTPLDQARVFYNADLVISPHGAQQANGLFLRGPGTVLVEVGCGEEAFSQLEDWHVDWTTYTRRLGTPTYVFTSLSAKPCQHFMRRFSVDAKALMGHLDSLLFTNASSVWDQTGVEPLSPDEVAAAAKEARAEARAKAETKPPDGEPET